MFGGSFAVLGFLHLMVHSASGFAWLVRLAASAGLATRIPVDIRTSGGEGCARAKAVDSVFTRFNVNSITILSEPLIFYCYIFNGNMLA